MKAIVQDRYGSADVLEFSDIPVPAVGENDVLVRVRAAGCGPDVWHIMEGKPYFARLALGFRRPKARVRGGDVAGVVEAVGSGVTGFAPGDEVMGYSSSGSFAEFAVVPAGKVAAKPPRLSFEEAAAVPISGATALRALQAADVSPGTKVLVTGAGGGPITGGFFRGLLRGPLLSLFVGQKMLQLNTKERADDLLALNELIEAGKVRPVIDRTYSLIEAPDAIRYLAEGHPRGKIVISV